VVDLISNAEVHHLLRNCKQIPNGNG